MESFFNDCADNAPCNLTTREKEWRDKFVDEYLVDYDEYKACIRLGYSIAYAKEFSIKFMNEPYVQTRIKEKEGAPVSELDVEAEKKRIITALWREANNHTSGSSQSARVAALSKLSAFYGMDAPSRSQQELTGKDGQPLGEGVFVIPGVVSTEEWAKSAAKQQEELIKPESPAKLTAVS